MITTQMSRFPTGYQPFYLFILASVVMFLLAACSGGGGRSSTFPEGFETFAEVLETIQERHVNGSDLSVAEFQESAIRGLIEVLEDPYSAYLTQQQFGMAADFSGQFDGIGAQVSRQNEQIVIVAPIEGSPAERAGIRAGDVVVGINGESLIGKSLTEAVLKIRGPKGTPVTISVIHLGDTTQADITIVRDSITIPSVTSRMEEPGIGYVRIISFVDPTGRQLREALEELLDQGAEGLVLDLRNNGGGLVSAAVEVTSQFVSDGLVLRSVDPDGRKTEFKVQSGGLAREIPLVVLVNGFTASAAEIVSGALQDHDRAILVGETTFGKGSVNLFTGLEDGSGLVITIARWLTPNGRLIEGNGLAPDVEAFQEGALPSGREFRELYQHIAETCGSYRETERGLQGAQNGVAEALELLCAENSAQPYTSSDSQMDTAIDLLKSRI